MQGHVAAQTCSKYSTLEPSTISVAGHISILQIERITTIVNVNRFIYLRRKKHCIKTLGMSEAKIY